VDEYRAVCAIWPRGTVPSDAHASLTARVPTLLISRGFDPVKPPAFADRVAQALPGARTILSPHTAHGACARPVALHVLAGGTLETMPVCR